MLEVPPGKQYPWVVNLYDLETLVECFQRKGLKGGDFLRFLRHRRAFQGRLTSDDELNIAGQFVVEGALQSPGADTCQFVTGYADLFDDCISNSMGFSLSYEVLLQSETSVAEAANLNDRALHSLRFIVP